MPLLATNNFKVQAGHRTGPGEVEIHAATPTFSTSSKVQRRSSLAASPSSRKTTGAGRNPGQGTHRRGRAAPTKGEVIVIPHGVPHCSKKLNGPLLYYVVKVSK